MKPTPTGQLPARHARETHSMPRVPQGAANFHRARVPACELSCTSQGPTACSCRAARAAGQCAAAGRPRTGSMLSENAGLPELLFFSSRAVSTTRGSTPTPLPREHGAECTRRTDCADRGHITRPGPLQNVLSKDLHKRTRRLRGLYATIHGPCQDKSDRVGQPSISHSSSATVDGLMKAIMDQAARCLTHRDHRRCSRRREFCNAAAPPSTFIWCLNGDKTGVPSK